MRFDDPNLYEAVPQYLILPDRSALCNSPNTEHRVVSNERECGLVAPKSLECLTLRIRSPPGGCFRERSSPSVLILAPATPSIPAAALESPYAAQRSSTTGFPS